MDKNRLITGIVSELLLVKDEESAINRIKHVELYLKIYLDEIKDRNYLGKFA
jgi:hypothetical protein